MRKDSLTEGRVLGVLLRFTVPILFALLLQALYGGVDLWVVGQFAETGDISGVSLGSLVTQTMTIFVTGISMGVTVLVGTRIGEEKPELAGKAVGSGICLFAALALILTGVMVGCAGIFTDLINAPEEAWTQTVDYLRICGAGTVFIVAYNLIGSVFRGIGDSKTPLVVVAIACVTNIIGDLLLVAGFRMGAAGAAVATIVAQCVSVLLSLAIITKKQSLPFRFSKEYIRFDGSIILHELRLGIPIALQDTLTCLAFLFIQTIINSFGVEASAGVGIAEKINSFIWLIPSAMAQSMSVFVAQNLGAGRPERSKRALRYGLLLSVVIGAFFFYLSFFHGDMLAWIFNRSGSVISPAHDYLRATGICCLFSPMLFCFTGYYNGLGKTLFVMVQGLIGTFLVRIPVTYWMSQFQRATIFHIGLGMPTGVFSQFILCLLFFLYLEWASRRKDERAEIL